IRTIKNEYAKIQSQAALGTLPAATPTAAQAVAALNGNPVPVLNPDGKLSPGGDPAYLVGTSAAGSGQIGLAVVDNGFPDVGVTITRPEYLDFTAEMSTTVLYADL